MKYKKLTVSSGDLAVTAAARSLDDENVIGRQINLIVAGFFPSPLHN
ncbi:hypothetical protein [Desulfocastanea catecholica]